MKKKTRKQIGIENFGKNSRREIPYWLKGVFDDPKDINWALVDMYERTIETFMLEHGDEFCEFIKKNTGEEVYWTPEGKIFGDTSSNLSHDDFEKILNEFVYSKIKEGKI